MSSDTVQLLCLSFRRLYCNKSYYNEHDSASNIMPIREKCPMFVFQRKSLQISFLWQAKYSVRHLEELVVVKQQWHLFLLWTRIYWLFLNPDGQMLKTFTMLELLLGQQLQTSERPQHRKEKTYLNLCEAKSKVIMVLRQDY